MFLLEKLDSLFLVCSLVQCQCLVDTASWAEGVCFMEVVVRILHNRLLWLCAVQSLNHKCLAKNQKEQAVPKADFSPRCTESAGSAYTGAVDSGSSNPVLIGLQNNWCHFPPVAFQVHSLPAELPLLLTAFSVLLKDSCCFFSVPCLNKCRSSPWESDFLVPQRRALLIMCS